MWERWDVRAQKWVWRRIWTYCQRHRAQWQRPQSARAARKSIAVEVWGLWGSFPHRTQRRHMETLGAADVEPTQRSNTSSSGTSPLLILTTVIFLVLCRPLVELECPIGSLECPCYILQLWNLLVCCESRLPRSCQYSRDDSSIG